MSSDQLKDLRTVKTFIMYCEDAKVLSRLARSRGDAEANFLGDWTTSKANVGPTASSREPIKGQLSPSRVGTYMYRRKKWYAVVENGEATRASPETPQHANRSPAKPRAKAARGLRART